MTNSRRKGKRGELGAARALRDLFPGLSVTRAGQHSGKEQADLRGTDGIHFEVKLRTKIGSARFMDQAVAECGEDVPAVLMRENNGEWLLTIRLNDLPRFIQRLPPTRPV